MPSSAEHFAKRIKPEINSFVPVRVILSRFKVNIEDVPELKLDQSYETQVRFIKRWLFKGKIFTLNDVNALEFDIIGEDLCLLDWKYLPKRAGSVKSEDPYIHLIFADIDMPTLDVS